MILLRSTLVFSILLMLIRPESMAQIRSYNNTVPVEGTPYLEDAYTTGTVYLKKENYQTDLRYNIYDDQVEFKRAGKIESLTADMDVQKVIIGKRTFAAEQFYFKGKLVIGFLVLLDTGKIGIRQKFNCVIAPAVPAAPFVDPKPPTYQRKADSYFIRIGTEMLKEIHTIKKLILLLPDHQKEMEEYAKKEKISADDPEELVKFSRYYNSLP